MSAIGPKQTYAAALHMSAFGGKADMAFCGCLLLRSLSGVKRTWVGALHMSAYDPKRTSTGYSVGTAAGRRYARPDRLDPDRGRRNRARAPQVVVRPLFRSAGRSAGPNWKLSSFCTRSSGLYLSKSNIQTSTNLAI